MDQRHARIKHLFKLYTNKSASAVEIKEFFELSSSNHFDEELKELIKFELAQTEIQEDYDKPRWDQVFEKIKIVTLTDAKPKNQRIKRTYRFVAAAAIALLVCGAALFLFSQRQGSGGKAVQFVTDIMPGKTGATLILANGKRITLSDARSGELAREAGVVIKKSAEGELIYEVQDKQAGENSVNTLSTARGETYMIVLPDKSKVWLNAASSITYTTKLYGSGEHSSRRVQLNGEAYFEISKDAEHPFVVESRGQEVEVLGTHFNISSYPDENTIKTTLLEGKVSVSEGNLRKILLPGYQVVNSGKDLEVEKVDTDLAIAWKNGIFQFYRADVRSVMRQLARWYNVDVGYQGAIPEHEFTGKIYRKVNMSEALTILSELDIKFRIEGRRIIVTP